MKKVFAAEALCTGVTGKKKLSHTNTAGKIFLSCLCGEGLWKIFCQGRKILRQGSLQYKMFVLKRMFQKKLPGMKGSPCKGKGHRGFSGVSV